MKRSECYKDIILDSFILIFICLLIFTSNCLRVWFIYPPFPNARADSSPLGPEIWNIQDAPDPQACNGYINITCEVDDGDGVAGVWANISVPEGGYHNDSMIFTGSFWYFNDSFSVEGVYNYIIWAKNVNDNWSYSTENTFSIKNAKQATLRAMDVIVEQGDIVSLPTVLMDSNGSPIPDELIAFHIDENRNGIYEGSELLGMSTTLTSGVATVGYTANLPPQNYRIWAKYEGSEDYIVREIEATLTVQNTDNEPPTILDIVPNQVKPEDSRPWTLDLSRNEADSIETGTDLKWHMTGVDKNLYTITGMNSSDDVFTFIPEKNEFGSDEVTLWLEDSNGGKVSQNLFINIIPINDPPYFDPQPPNIMVQYDDPLTWDYSFYAHDVETPLENLVLTTSEPTVDSGDGYAVVEGLEVTFNYPQSRAGESILVSLTLSDGVNSTHTLILVNVTSEPVPRLENYLPDISIDEDSILYNVFDLDEYFVGMDQDVLTFNPDYNHIQVNINENGTVDIEASGHWTGSDFISFRARDTTGAIVEDTIIVTVMPVNDAPVIENVPDLVVHFDYPYRFDLSPYISDPDNPVSDLIVWSSEATDRIWLHPSNDLGIVVNYPESMNDTTFPVRLYVSDGSKMASQLIQITVSNDFPPEIALPFEEVCFDEGSFFENAFNLNDHFLDSEGDTLFYTFSVGFIDITINEDLSVNFTAPENWYGSEIVTFRATDPFGAIIEGKVQVVVVPVNDAPTLRNIPRQDMEQGEIRVLDLSQYIEDVDDDVYELQIIVKNKAGQEYITLVGDILILEYPDDVHDDVINVTISDGEAQDIRSFTVKLPGPSPILPSFWVIFPWLVLFLIIVVGGAFAFHRNKSRYLAYEAFLLYEGTVPIAHASQDESSRFDDIAVGTMFTAVQDFIRDAFTDKTDDDEWELDEMAFGENQILIERSQNLYLAVVFEGNGANLRYAVKKVLRDFDGEYHEVLKDWDGDVSRLPKAKDMVEGLITTKKLKKKITEPTKVRGGAESEDLVGPLVSLGEIEEGIEEEEKELGEKIDLWELPPPNEASESKDLTKHPLKQREKGDKVLDLPIPKKESEPTPISEHVLSGDDSLRELPIPKKLGDGNGRKGKKVKSKKSGNNR